jgi:hypothetical protein
MMYILCGTFQVPDSDGAHAASYSIMRHPCAQLPDGELLYSVSYRRTYSKQSFWAVVDWEGDDGTPVPWIVKVIHFVIARPHQSANSSPMCSEDQPVRRFAVCDVYQTKQRQLHGINFLPVDMSPRGKAPTPFHESYAIALHHVQHKVIFCDGAHPDAQLVRPACIFLDFDKHFAPEDIPV